MSFTCFECAKPARHGHHVVPISHGGTRTLPLCEQCHSKAHSKNMVIGELIKQGLRRRKEKNLTLGRPRTIDRQKVLELKRNGNSMSGISRQVGCSRAAIEKILRMEGAK